MATRKIFAADNGKDFSLSRGKEALGSFAPLIYSNEAILGYNDADFAKLAFASASYKTGAVSAEISGPLAAPTVLAAGDIAFSAYQADNSGGDYNGDAFEFVLLKAVSAGTIIYFTDGGFQTDTNRFRTNEGLVRWTAQTDLPAGALVTFRGNNASGVFTNTAEWTGLDPVTGAVITTGPFSLAAAGDSIHAFQGAVFGGANALNGTAIAAMSIGGPDGFEAVHIATSSNAETGLATGLTDGVNAVSFVGRANARYDETATGSIEVGTAAQIRASLNSDTLWQTLLTQGGGAGSGVFNPGGHAAGTFQISAGTINIAPSSISLNEGNSGTTAYSHTVTRSTTAADTSVQITITGGAGITAADIASVTVNGVPVAGFTLGSAFTVALTGAATTATVAINVAGDTTFEANETFTITLTAPTAGYTLGTASATDTITNDDAAANAAPVIDLNGAVAGTGVALAYTENAAATAIAPAAIVTDANSANFNGGSLTVAVTSGTGADQLTIQNQGNGAGQIGVAGSNVNFGGTIIGTVAGGANGAALVVTLNSAATPAAVEALTRAILYANTSDTPAASRTVTFTVVDGGGTANGGADTGAASATINITAVDDAPVAVADSGSVAADSTAALTVLANDTDVDGGPINAATINGNAISVGQTVTLASGAQVTRNADGTLTYNPNGAFNGLISTATATATGASNTSAVDSFTYALNGGSSATVTVTISGVDGLGDQLIGTANADNITGTASADIILALGNNDTVNGGAGDDIVDGGGGVDILNGDSGNDRLILGTTASGSTINGGADTDTLVVTSTVISLAGLLGIEALELNGGAGITLTGTQFANGLAKTTAVSGTGSITVNMDAGINFLSQSFGFTGGGVTVNVNGSNGDDIIKCGNGVHIINAGDGNDQIRGGTLADTINGGAGNDKIIGNAGADIITGGTGSDQYRYLLASDSGVGAGSDRITDFEIGVDKFNFSQLDTNPGLAGIQGFAFVGNAAFSGGGAASIRYTTSGADLLVQADVNGDGIADMEIILQGLGGGALTGGDFIL